MAVGHILSGDLEFGLEVAGLRLLLERGGVRAAMPVGLGVVENRWTDFFRERRIEPFLRAALDSGHLSKDLATQVELFAERTSERGGDEPRPTLPHGDAQRNNYVSTDAGAVIVDASPFFGHPEIDLAMVDLFQTVPADVFDAYREIRPIDPGFEARRELWRVPAYLAVIAVDGGSTFGSSVHRSARQRDSALTSLPDEARGTVRQCTRRHRR